LFGQRTADKDLELLAVFDRDVPHDLVGDPLRLNQVLVNLTNNAIKFTDQGEIILRVDCLKKTDKMVKLLFSVKDRGIGIGENAAKGLFSAFTQADGSTTRKYGGTGLGLAICKKLVGLMQGDIWLESTLGQGSAFYFTALFGRQDSESPVRLEMPSELHGKKILLVGSREISLGVMQELISSFMLDVETASSGAEATRMLKESKEKENRFALILMDWHQEDRDFVTSFDRIRNDEPLSRIPLVILTALRRDDDMQMARTAGVFALLRKPVRISLLFNTLLDAFGRPDRKISFGDDSADYQESYYTEFLKGAKVLLVEDNDINRQVATELLENVGITVEAVKNGRKAVDAVFHNQYDAVLMDIQMPEMDGFEATEAIRKEKRFADLPIIAMTANVMAEDRERCLGFGMNDYVSKPVEPVALYSVLSRYVQVDKGRSSTPGPLRFDATVQENIREYDLKGIDVKAGI
ncbi:MAG: response regulator, partial [Desulfobulbaceae bacterium]|nr:response regulator [Desulfobulbaceae bacterium]